MRIGILISCALWATVAVYVTGCSGIGAGLDFNVRRIDNYSAQNNTKQRNTKPFACWFTTCPEARQNQGDESYGS